MRGGDGNSSLQSAPGAFSLKNLINLLYWYGLRALTTIGPVLWDFFPLVPEGSKSQYLTLCQNARRNHLALLDSHLCIYFVWNCIIYFLPCLLLVPWEIPTCFYLPLAPTRSTFILIVWNVSPVFNALFLVDSTSKYGINITACCPATSSLRNLRFASHVPPLL